MEKFTIANLKKQLSLKSKDELVKEIAKLCQTFPQVTEYYKAQGSDIQEVVKKYKDIIEKEFTPNKTKRLPRARFSVVRKAVNDFKKLTDDPELIANIMLTYVESVSAFNTEYDPDVEDFYTRPEDMFETVLVSIQKHDLLDEFKSRAHNIVKNATEGWGHQESLQERYEEVYGDFVE